MTGAQSSLRYQYFSSNTQLTMQLLNVPLALAHQQGNQANLYSEEMALAQNHTSILQGHLPSDAGGGAILQAAITAPTASALHLTVGSTLPLDLSFYTNTDFMSNSNIAA